VDDWCPWRRYVTSLHSRLFLLSIGKTILASAIVDKCKEMSGSTAFYYCHEDDQTSTFAVSILKGIAGQLIAQNPQLLPPCYKRYVSSGISTLRSFAVATRLLEDICIILPKIYIVVDGLNECENIERKQVVETMMQIVNQCEKAEPGKLRLLFVSQNFADIHRALHNSSRNRLAPLVFHLSDADNKNDINTYVRAWVARIAANNAPFSEDLMDYLQRMVISNAAGSFMS
jgi:hypothetical protein